MDFAERAAAAGALPRAEESFLIAVHAFGKAEQPWLEGLAALSLAAVYRLEGLDLPDWLAAKPETLAVAPGEVELFSNLLLLLEIIPPSSPYLGELLADVRKHRKGCGMASVSPAETPALDELRQGAEVIFARAENARDLGDLENAARLFGRAAGTWRTAGNVLEAADAFIELGAVLLRKGRGHLLPDLSARLLVLLEMKPLPEGALLNLRVYAALIAKANENREAFLGMVQERRLFRHRFGRGASMKRAQTR